VVGYLNPDMKSDIKRSIISEAVVKVRPEEISGMELQPGVEEDPFKYMREDDTVASQSPMEEDMEKTFDGWNKLRASISTGVYFDQFPLLHRDVWIDLFIRYNTPLPSSAAVERLFSSGSDILRPKRSTLTADNFEKLVFLKGNLHLLDAKRIAQLQTEDVKDG
jgi:hypothetical protein